MINKVSDVPSTHFISGTQYWSRLELNLILDTSLGPEIPHPNSHIILYRVHTYLNKMRTAVLPRSPYDFLQGNSTFRQPFVGRDKCLKIIKTY
jgi:hypothetical protein